MKSKKYRYFVGDFETTVYDGQEYTEVWASALVEIGSEDVTVMTSIDETYNFLKEMEGNVCVYYHNLKFDGHFWLYFLMKKIGLKQAIKTIDDTNNGFRFEKDSDMAENTFKYNISDMGQWYRIVIRVNKKFIEIRDSLKLLPFTVKKIGESFGTKHKKLDIEYKGIRHAGGYISESEKEYIKNDVLVVKEALEIMFKDGHDKLTIGSCCLEEFRRNFDHKEYKTLFPNLYECKIDAGSFGDETAGEYIHRSYKGGWCYLVPEKANTLRKNGVTLDVNSLYPSMMHSISGNVFPVGRPNFWKGQIPKYVELNKKSIYYFVRIRTRFRLKRNKLPCIQIKGNILYRANEWLTTSDIRLNDNYYPYYIDTRGIRQPALVTLTLTCVDYILIKDHYDLYDTEILDGCWFYTADYLFDRYINKYKKIKQESEGAIREEAKLFLNNLYGKLAASIDSSFKIATINKDGKISFIKVKASEKEPGYIAIGSAITSYSRNFTIRAAQKNYYGPHKPGFIYADTDSIHCDIDKDNIKGVTLHNSEFCCWKCEGVWDEAIFVRQKTYAERMIIDSKERKIDNPEYDIKCAGMPDRCKNIFVKSLNGIISEEEKEQYSKEEIAFIENGNNITDFKVGLIVPGSLKAKNVDGGIVLKESDYEMRPI